MTVACLFPLPTYKPYSSQHDLVSTPCGNAPVRRGPARFLNVLIPVACQAAEGLNDVGGDEARQWLGRREGDGVC